MTSAIIVAAGKGRRFGSTKQFASLCGKPVIFHTIEVFEHSRSVHEIVLVVPKGWVKRVEDRAVHSDYRKVKNVVPGGPRRMDSVYCGLQVASGDIVVIHDGVRPLVTSSMINRGVSACRTHGACTYAIHSTDTVKFAENGSVTKTVDRTVVYLTQTPQIFKKSIIMKAYANAYAQGIDATDDSYLVELIGVPVRILEGSRENMKITSSLDLRLVRALME